ncbi:MAG: hypothetical protein M1818_004496 [Claussenomyces sp. TS43310]|nr:MAG: hypothetical protein M1818_004496 [Claussenomyces sp. TS43310]
MSQPGIPSDTAKLQNKQGNQQSAGMSSGDLGIENTNISTAVGVNLSAHQKILVGSVLDLFAGRPSLKKLQLWADDASFHDPITKAEGRKQYEPQWYGLQTAFSEIERLHHSVTSAGNPIKMDLKTRYKVKGIGVEKVIESVVNIHTTPDGKIRLVEDRWNNELPDGAFAKASWSQVVSPRWWFHYWFAWVWYLWSLVWWTWPWLAFRNLNSVTVPAFVSVPKNEEEDRKKGN